MRFDKFTIKSQELIQNAQSSAAQHNHQQIEPEHLLAAMLNEPPGACSASLGFHQVTLSKIFQKQ
jgi:ATP-dependent Clp protease ATP-binding subunit ClpB